MATKMTRDQLVDECARLRAESGLWSRISVACAECKTHLANGACGQHWWQLEYLADPIAGDVVQALHYVDGKLVADDTDVLLLDEFERRWRVALQGSVQDDSFAALARARSSLYSTRDALARAEPDLQQDWCMHERHGGPFLLVHGGDCPEHGVTRVLRSARPVTADSMWDVGDHAGAPAPTTGQG